DLLAVSRGTPLSRSRQGRRSREAPRFCGDGRRERKPAAWLDCERRIRDRGNGTKERGKSRGPRRVQGFSRQGLVELTRPPRCDQRASWPGRAVDAARVSTRAVWARLKILRRRNWAGIAKPLSLTCAKKRAGARAAARAAPPSARTLPHRASPRAHR